MNKNQILSELGDIPETVYDELVSEAFEQSGRQLVELRQFVSAGQSRKAVSVAHSMKGCFANLRLNEVSHAASALEAALKNGAQSEEIDARVSELSVLLRLQG